MRREQEHWRQIDYSQRHLGLDFPDRLKCSSDYYERSAYNKGHRVQQLEQRLLLGEAYLDNGLVFAGPLGGPLDPSVLTHTFRRLALKAGLSGVRLHDLRHAHASLLLKEGTHPKIVQERLGHATIAITLDTYSHVVPSLQVEAANVFAGAMAKAANRD